MKILYLSVLCLATAWCAQGQLIKKEGTMHFKSILQPGILIGQKNSLPAFQVTTINGLKYKTWFGGIGAGIDYYGGKRSIPLFINLQKDIALKPVTWFLFASAGYNLPWLKEGERLTYMQGYSATAGIFYEAGLGYKFSRHFGFSTAYSVKQFKESYTYNCYWCEFTAPLVDTHTYRRLSIKFNWWLL